MHNWGDGERSPTIDDPHRIRLALHAAQLYYVQEMTMDAIARELKVSRSSVSRLLSAARESGLVEIKIHSPQEARNHLEALFADRYGVTAHVVPVPTAASGPERLQRTARVAAGVLTAAAHSNLTIGLAWGATLSAVARHLPSRPLHDVHVVQMNGAMNLRTEGLSYAGDLLGRFSAAFGATLHEFPVPAFFDDPNTKRAMWRERSVRSVLSIQASVGLFFFGLGAPKGEVPSHVYTDGYLDSVDMTEIMNSGIVGDCATVFYRRDGSDHGLALNERSSGPPLDTIRMIPHRLCVVSGRSKRQSLQGALSAGLITELVVDEGLARSVLGR